MQRHSPLNWELCNKAWRGGAGSVCGTQTDGNMDPLVKKACVWADGGSIQEWKANKEEPHFYSKP